jgi:hypothetical protein
MGMRPAKIRYADILEHECSKCDVRIGKACVDTVTGKERRVPHRERIEAAHKSPRRRVEAPPAAMPQARHPMPPVSLPVPSNAVLAMLRHLADAFKAS